MKDRERQPEKAPKRLHTTAQYSLEELLVRTQSGQAGEEQAEQSGQAPSVPSESRTQPAHKKEDTAPVSVDQREGMLEAVEQAFAEPAGKEALKTDREEAAPLWKKWSGKLKQNKTVNVLRQKIHQVRKDEQPDEMEKIYGDRPMLTPIEDSGRHEEKPAPQFGYLFGQQSGEEAEDSESPSFFQREPGTEQQKKETPSNSPDKQTEGSDSAFPRKSDAQASLKTPVLERPEKDETAPDRQKKKESASTADKSALAEKKTPSSPKKESDPLADWSPLSRRKDAARGEAPFPAVQEKKEDASAREKKQPRLNNIEAKKERKAGGNSQEKKENTAAQSPMRPPNEKGAKGADTPKKPGRLKEGVQVLSKSQEEPKPSMEKTAPTPESRYEKLFGKPQPAKSAKAPAQGKKRRKGEPIPAQLFNPSPSKKAILLNPEADITEVLQDEYEEYRRTQKDEREQAASVPARKPEKKQPAKEERKSQKDKFSIFGEVEPEDQTQEETPRQELPALEDYSQPGDAFSIKAELIDHMRTVIVRTAVTAVAAMLSIAAVVLYCVDLPFAQALRGNAYWYLAANLALLGIAAGFSYVPMGVGMKALFRFKGNSDSAIAFAVWIALIHGAAAFFTPQSYLDGGLNVYGCLAALGLFLNSWGKLILVRRVYANFKYVSSPEKKHAVKIVSDERLAEKLCRGMGLEKSIVAYQRPVGFLSNFLRLSYEPDPSEKLAGKIAPVGALATLIVGAGAYLFTQDIQSALAALSISACVCVPMCCVPAVNLLIRGVCKRALRMGSMLVGYPGVRQFADTNAVVLEAGQLYPGNSVVLHGIKGFSGERIDQAILEAGAVLTKANAPMASTFDQIIQGKGELLPKVDSVSYEDEMGVIGWVGGRRVLVGNRKLLEEHGVTPPEQSLEDQYKQNGRQVTYLATAGELKALFVTSYVPDQRMMAQMQRLEAQGVCFLIRTSDPNVTERMVSDHFQVYYRSVRVLPEDLSQEFACTPEQEKETARAYLATKGKATVMQRMITSCIRVRNKVTFSLILQAFAVVVTFLLVAFMIFASSLKQLGTVEMLIYTLFWVLAVLILPCIRRA